MPAQIEERTFDNARSFVDYLIHDSDQGSLFRGQSDATWPLLPSAWREGQLARMRGYLGDLWGDRWPELLSFTNLREPSDLSERFMDARDEQSIGRLKALVLWLAAEQTIVNAFCSNCDRVALDVPGANSPDWSNSLSERAVYLGPGARNGRFRREVPLYEPSSSHALAQHMSIPTRLLDFSDNPLKAAYFALPQTPLPLMGLGREEFMCVWAVTPPESELGDEIMEKVRMLLRSQIRTIRVLRSQIANLHAQDGLFLCCNETANSYFLVNGEWPSFDLVMHEWHLQKLQLPRSEQNALRSVLGRLGINSTTLSPSYTQAATDARRLL